MKIDVGRNDFCPCKSGRKFKKCCIDNPLNLFPHFMPPRTSHWSQGEIREIPTEKIVEKLKMVGVRFSEKDFLKDVKKSLAAHDIYVEWLKRYQITAEGFDQDFVWMACEVLWERLSPDRISTEQIDNWMQDGYGHIEMKSWKKGCELWMKVWEALKPRFTSDMKSIDNTEAAFKGSQLLSNWCQDFEQELGNIGNDDKAFHEHRIRYCREFLALFPKSDALIIHNMRKAVGESLFSLGRKDEGDKEFENLVSDFPNNPWGYIGWGDMYKESHGDIPKDSQRAEELYRKALGLDKNEDKTVKERIRDCLKERENPESGFRERMKRRNEKALPDKTQPPDRSTHGRSQLQYHR